MNNEKTAIPEDFESAPLFLAAEEDDDDTRYILDLGSGAMESGCPTPMAVPPLLPYAADLQMKRTLLSTPPPRRLRRDKDAERECGICFELATAPVRTLCCNHIFCAEHILAWLDGPQSDGLCPTCRAPSAATGLLALGHPALLHLVPRAPPPSRSPSPASIASVKSASYAAYPFVPAPSSSSCSASWSSSSSPSSESEDEDTTDYSLPALVRARALQTRRHVAHPLASVLGLRGTLVCVLRAAAWVLVIAVLAGRARGRWGVAIDGAGAGAGDVLDAFTPGEVQ